MEQEHIFRALFEHSSDGIIITDPRGKIVMANARAARMLGYEHGTLLTLAVEEVVPERLSLRHQQLRQAYQASPKPRPMGSSQTLYARRADGTEFPVEISLSAISLPDQELVVAVIIDITEREKSRQALLESEQRLRTYTRKLEHSNRELQEFAYICSHDLQEPLRKIQAFGSRLQQKEGHRLSEHGQAYFGRMLHAADRMHNLINDLLTYSRVTTRARPMKEVDLNHILAGVLTDLELAVEQSCASLRIDPLPTIMADATQMSQLFQNLLSNALKFHQPDTPPRIHVYATPSSHKAPEGYPSVRFVDVHVVDQGIGFPEKFKEQIFQVFQRLEGRKYEGSGIGLAICKKIINRHHGYIQVRSEPGEGTHFTLSFPQQQDVFQLEE